MPNGQWVFTPITEEDRKRGFVTLRTGERVELTETPRLSEIEIRRSRCLVVVAFCVAAIVLIVGIWRVCGA
jgi:stage III sporulation protein SpoIIIAA